MAKACVILAVALVTGCTTTTAPPTSPIASVDATGTAETDTWVATKGEFSLTYRLDGATQASSWVGIDVPSGMRFAPTDSGAVAAGSPIGSLVAQSGTKHALERDAATSTVSASRLAAIRAYTSVAKAPVAGNLSMDKGAPRIATPGLDLTASLSPLQALRYRGANFTGSAAVETVLGPQQAACSAIWLVAGGAVKGGATVHCRLPNSLETVAGIPGVLTLVAPTQQAVIAVPGRYIGLDTSGRNYVARVGTGDEVADRPVVVGTTDGVRRVVLSGLREGDTLQVFPE